jgi:hypothetical protein
MKKIIILGLYIFLFINIQAQNVGIGTATPVAKLNIVGNGSSPVIPGTTSSAIFRIGKSPDEGIDFGKLPFTPFSAWIQAGFGSITPDPISLQPLGGNVGIGILSPALSAKLDVSSTTQGFLPPRMTLVQRNAIPAPVAGLIVWCSNCGYNGELNVYNGTAWTNMIGNPFTPAQSPPSVITTAISNINPTSALSGGNITSDGYSAITARGVCWNTATNPTVALPTKTNNGTGTGIFVSNITGLTLGITYYVRAYATNALGTSYGAEFSFTTDIAIGENYQGGIVAYILQSGDPGYIAGQIHGLIAAVEPISSSVEWGCFLTAIPGADGLAVGTGNQNTIDIMAGCSTSGIAARICGNLILNGYSDWYLPSRDELYKLYIIGRLGVGSHWSSSELSNSSAWVLSVSDEGGVSITSSLKPGLLYVHAVRSF